MFLCVCVVSLKELDFIDTFVYYICLVCSYITFHFSLQHPFRTRNALLPKSVLPLLHTLPCLLLFVSCWVYVSNYYDIEDFDTMIRIRISCPYLISLSINPYPTRISSDMPLSHLQSCSCSTLYSSSGIVMNYLRCMRV